MSTNLYKFLSVTLIYDCGRQTRLKSELDWMDNLLREFGCVEFLGKCEEAELG